VTRFASAAFAVALVALVWSLLHLAWYRHGQIVDYTVYKKYGNRIAHAHQVPYRDFSLEYPPAALPVFAVPAWLDRLGFVNVFQAFMVLCDAALVLCVLAVGGRRAAALAAVAPLALGSVVVSRFDLWPAALAAGALAALVRRRPLLSGVLLGTAFAAKLWPAVLVPLFVVWLWRTEERRALTTWTAAALGTALVWFVPFVALAPRGVGHSFHRQLARPLQIESLGASVLVAVHHLFGTTLGVLDSFGSQNAAGSGVGAVGVLTSVLEVLAVLCAWLAFARGEATIGRLLVASAASVAALVAFGKVYSPQFGIWLIPFVALVPRVAPRALLLVALVLTQLYFPKHYWNYANGLYRSESAIVLLRNLTVVALFAVLLASLARQRESE
jgi:hypothetical protein